MNYQLFYNYFTTINYFTANYKLSTILQLALNYQLFYGTSKNIGHTNVGR